MTLAGFLYRAARQLENAGFIPGDIEASRIVEPALGLKRADRLSRPDRVLTDEEATLLESLVRSRLEGVPVQYLAHEAAFRNLDLAVGPGVFIPRPETEGLVDHVLAFLRSLPAQRAPLVLDLGLGSGAVLASILDEFPRALGVGVEASRLALDCARRNLATAGGLSRARLDQGDLFEPLAIDEYGGAFDAIVSNPPYIPEDEWERLPRDVRDFEPRLALLGGRDGLAVIRRIVAGAPDYLRAGGLLALEIDASHGGRLRTLLEAEGAYAEIRIEPDLAGRPRYCLARTRLARTRRRSRSMRDGLRSNEA